MSRMPLVAPAGARPVSISRCALPKDGSYNGDLTFAGSRVTLFGEGLLVAR